MPDRTDPFGNRLTRLPRLHHMPPERHRLRNWTGMALSAAIISATMVLIYLAMRQLMDLGGSCASGGPYVSAQPCPEGGAIVLSVGIPLLFVAGAAFAAFAWRLGDRAPGLLLLAWAGLFLSLGWNFIEWGIVEPRAGFDIGYALPGVLFLLMGAPALWPFAMVARGLGERRAMILLVFGEAIVAGVIGGWLLWGVIA